MLSPMPIYEYLCADCSGTFEERVRGETDDVHCPDCGASTVTRLLSSFATPRPVMAGGGGGGGGGCCGGSCGCGH
jgi:putative FmdB family regulatory protein